MLLNSIQHTAEAEAEAEDEDDTNTARNALSREWTREYAAVPLIDTNLYAIFISFSEALLTIPRHS
jgi:hypothetical protein